MAFPTVPTAAATRLLTGTQANTTATRATGSLAGLTKNAGDLLIAIFVGYQTSTGTNAAFSGWSAGWTEFHDSATSTTMPIGMAYKWSTGSETGTVTATQAGTITGQAAWFLLSIPGAHATSPPEAGGRVSGTTAAPNPTALTPSWGSADTLWIALSGNGETATTGTFDGIGAPPTGYTDQAFSGISADVVGGVEGSVAFKQATAASEDAGVWTLDTSNARNAALTIAVRGTASLPTISTLTSTFDTMPSFLDGNFGGPSIVGGQLSVPTIGTYAAAATATNAVALAGSSVLVQVVTASGTSGTRQNSVKCQVDATNSVEMMLDGGTFHGRVTVAGANTDTALGTYSPTSHAWWRIRESGGTVYWDASADGLTWSNLGSATHGLNLSAVKFLLQAGFYGTETGTVPAVYDNLNTPPAPPAGATPVIREVVSGATTGAATTLTTSSAVKTDDLLVAFHAVDWASGVSGALTGLGPPTPGTWDLRAAGDRTAVNSTHLRLYTRLVTADGAQSVTFPSNTATADTAPVLVVVDGSTIDPADWIDGVAGAGSGAATNTAGATPHIAPSVTTGQAADLFLVGFSTNNENAGGPPTYTSGPSGMTETRQTASGYVRCAVWNETLGAAGATGTRTATPSVAKVYESVSLAIKGSGTVASDVTGTSAATGPAPTSSASATATATGSSSATATAATATAAATDRVTATGAGTAPSATSTATATGRVTATSSATAPTATSSAAGTGRPPLSSLTSTFDTMPAFLDANSALVSVVDGQLSIPTTSSYHSAATSASYNFVGDGIYGRITPATPGGSRETILWAWVDDNNGISMSVSSGSFLGRVKVDGTNNDNWFRAYFGPTDAWWRMRESVGTVYWDVSPDGVTWTTLGSAVHGLSLSAVRFVLFSGHWGAETSPSPTLVDSLNTLGPTTSGTVYVDQAGGSDSNDGASAATPWATIDKVNRASLAAGTSVLFKRGQTWANTSLIIGNSGTSGSRLLVGAYGSGADPILDGGGTSTPATVVGNYVTVQDVKVQNAGGVSGGGENVGVSVFGTDCLVQRAAATANSIAVMAQDGAHRLRVTESNLHDNNRVIIRSGADDDYGANGVIVAAADDCEIDHNTITGHYGVSTDYGYDGSAIDFYGSIGSTVHHNVIVDNLTLCELGNARTANIEFHDNLITSNLGAIPVEGLVVQGTGTFGPVLGTKFYNNTVVLTGSGARALWVGAGADLEYHNNVVVAPMIAWLNNQKIDEGHNVFQGDTTFMWSTANAGTNAIAPTSVVADPLFVGGGDYRLQVGSPAIDRGTARSYTTDLDGNPRVVGAAIDAGAYEAAAVVTGTAAGTAPTPTTSASATERVTGTGAGTTAAATSSAAATDRVTGSSSATGPSPTSTSSATGRVTGTSSATAPVATSSATADAIPPVTGTAANTAPASSSSGSASGQVAGAVAGTGPTGTSSTAGTAYVAGTVAGTAPTAESSSSATAHVTGTVAGTSPTAESAASGTAVEPGTGFGLSVPPAATSAATGTTWVTGTAAGTAPTSTSSSSATGRVTGTSASTGPSATSSASAGAIPPVTATVSSTAPAATSSGSATERVTGTSSTTAPAATSTASATPVVTAAGSSTGPAASSTAEGQTYVDATSAGAAPAPTSTGAGSGEVTGTSAAVMAPAVVAGTDSGTRVAVVVHVIAPPQAAGTGTAWVTGTGSGTAPWATSSAAGAIVSPGPVESTGPAPSSSATGLVVVLGTVASTAPSAQATASADGRMPINVASTAPAATAAGTGALEVVGVGAGVMAPAQAEGAASLEVVGAGASTSPAPAAVFVGGGPTPIGRLYVGSRHRIEGGLEARRSTDGSGLYVSDRVVLTGLVATRA